MKLSESMQEGDRIDAQDIADVEKLEKENERLTYAVRSWLAEERLWVEGRVALMARQADAIKALSKGNIETAINILTQGD